MRDAVGANDDSPLPCDYCFTGPGVVVVAAGAGVAAGGAVSGIAAGAGVAAGGIGVAAALVAGVAAASGMALGAVGATGGAGGIMNGGKLLFMPGCIPNGATGRG